MHAPKALVITASLLLGMEGAICQAQAASPSPSAGAASDTGLTLSPGKMPATGTVDPRFQSYNIEMIELTGGKFWKPYGAKPETSTKTADSAATDTPGGMDPNIYEYRPPLDLTNPRIRKLAQALGPAYVRSSGTWANTSFFAETDKASTTPPKGFGGVLTREQWKGLITFSKAVDAEIVTSFANSPGTRDAKGVWTTEQAKRFVDYTQSVGGEIAAAEFMNEPTLAAMGGAPAGYTEADYGRDFKVFTAFAKQHAPGMKVLGPGSVAETSGDYTLMPGMTGVLKTEDLLKHSENTLDAFSYHYYGAASQRCAGAGFTQTTQGDALTEAWLGRTDQTLNFYRKMRDRFTPGKPLWVTETADAACGGNPWAGTFTDTFRYLDQLGRLAKQHVQVVMHNTLIASDYGLLDSNTFEPKPSYWGALLWSKFMGTTVLDSGVPIKEGQHVYAQCLKGTPGGVALMAINNSATNTLSLALPTDAKRYTLAAKTLDTKTVELNGKTLQLGANDALPSIEGVEVAKGNVKLEPSTITFLTLAHANNAACK